MCKAIDMYLDPRHLKSAQIITSQRGKVCVESRVQVESQVMPNFNTSLRSLKLWLKSESSPSHVTEVNISGKNCSKNWQDCLGSHCCYCVHKPYILIEKSVLESDQETLSTLETLMIVGSNLPPFLLNSTIRSLVNIGRKIILLTPLCSVVNLTSVGSHHCW